MNSPKVAGSEGISKREAIYTCKDRNKALHNQILFLHMRAHAEEKPFICKACDQGFATSSQLRVQRRRNLRQMPHRCCLCPERFTTKFEQQSRERSGTEVRCSRRRKYITRQWCKRHKLDCSQRRCTSYSDLISKGKFQDHIENCSVRTDKMRNNICVAALGCNVKIDGLLLSVSGMHVVSLIELLYNTTACFIPATSSASSI